MNQQCFLNLSPKKKKKNGGIFLISFFLKVYATILFSLPDCFLGFPIGSVLKNPPPYAGDIGDMGSFPWSRK